MGEMADYYCDMADVAHRDTRDQQKAELQEDQRIWDMVHGIRPGSDKQCKHCFEAHLFWRQVGGKWRLYSGADGSVHDCPSPALKKSQETS